MSGPTHIHGHKPRVSVVMPVFNAEPYLQESIESVLYQPYRDFELIVVEDGSTDRSRTIAKEWASREPKRVRYLEHPHHANRGATVSRNLALREAQGDLVAFIDADDRWRPSKLMDQVELLDRMPEVDAVCGAVNFWSSHAGEKDRIIPTGHVRNRRVAPPEALLNVYPLGKADPPCPSDLLMRRSIVEAIGGFEESFKGCLQLYEDQAFLAKFFLEGTIYFDDRIWLDYRVHEASCTAWVNAAALQPDARRYCLEWFETYLNGTRFKYDPRIRLALALALRPYRHPYLSRAAGVAKQWLGLGSMQTADGHGEPTRLG